MVAVRLLFVTTHHAHPADRTRFDAHLQQYDLELGDVAAFRDANRRIQEHVRHTVRAEAMRLASTRTSTNIAPFDPNRGDRPWTQLFVHNGMHREALLLSEHAWDCILRIMRPSPCYLRKIVVRVDLDASSEAEIRRVMLALGAWRNNSPLLSSLTIELLEHIALRATQ